MARILARTMLAGAAIAGGAMLYVAPAAAQNAPENGVLVIYGNQKCPTDQNGNEIVVCQRRNADEQFRIPKEMRERVVTPDNQSWAARDQQVLSAGQTGVGTCSVVGAMGATGCTMQAVRAAKAERKKQAEEQADIP
jgi:hypothetical protein